MVRRFILIILLLVAAVTLATQPNATTRPAATQPAATTQAATQPAESIRVLFSPHGGCTQAIVEQIGAARTTIDLQAYYFTSAEIAHAVAVAAHDRGVKVRAILDHRANGSKYTEATYLFNHGIDVWTDARHPIAHNKVIVIDGQTVITGSFNFTKQAESNAENLLIFSGHQDIADQYEKNFEEHLSHSQKYEGIKATTRPTGD